MYHIGGLFLVDQVIYGSLTLFRYCAAFLKGGVVVGEVVGGVVKCWGAQLNMEVNSHYF